MYMLKCHYCQTEFTPSRINSNKPRKFCSNTCAGAARLSKTLTYCIVCKTETYNPKFCSKSCSAIHNNKLHPKRVKTYNVCPTCGTQHSRPKFCSDECNPNRLHLTEEEKYRYIRSKKNESWARYMAKKKNQTPADADINAIRLFYFHCPVGYEVDHIIPISKGGLHTLENLQYLTITENRKKSNKLL